MPANLKTEWKIIGRSGPTVDGRNIEAKDLEQAAKNYNQSTFTALIWPEHERWYNMGTVEKLMTAKNDEGGIDLLAILAPNDYYLSANAYGQKLFTSMELMPNFRDSGETYLTGLAATDNPASAGTSAVRFSSNTKQIMQAPFIESGTFTQPESDEPPGWFKRLFKTEFTPDKDNDTMNAQQFAALTAALTALTTKVESLSAKPTETTTDTQAPAEVNTTDTSKNDTDFNALSAKVDLLLTKFAALENKTSSSAQEQQIAQPSVEEISKLSAAVDKLQKELQAAINHQGGTAAGEYTGDNEDLNQYI